MSGETETGSDFGFWGSPTGWPMHLIVAAFACVTLWRFTLPGLPNLAYLVLGMFAWGGLGSVWMIRLILYLLRHRRLFVPAGHRLQWAISPALVVVVAALIVFQVPLRARFLMGRADLERFAKAVQEQGPIRVDKRGRIGTYLVQPWSVERTQGGSRFLIKGAGVYGVSGFALSPEVPPRRTQDDRYQHLTGPWYVWEAGFD